MSRDSESQSKYCWHSTSVRFGTPQPVANTIPESHRDSPGAQDSVVVGRIRGPWGIRGELKVEPLTDFPDRFSEGSVLFLDGRPARVLRSRSHKNGFVVKLDLVDDRSHAESLLGSQLTVPRDELRPLPKGSYYHFQIIDMEVWTEEGGHLGRVKEIIATGGNDVYVVGNGERKELLVPALGDVVLKVDQRENRMVVRLPEGLG